MRFDVSQFVDQIAESATIVLDEKAKSLQNEGRSIVNFAAAEPDVNTASSIIDAACQAAQKGATKYTPVAGLLPVREAIANFSSRIYKTSFLTRNVIVTNGGKQAIFHAFQCLLNPGDEVLLPAPYWGSFVELIKMVGAKPVIMPHWDFVDDLDRFITERTRLLIFNNPHNPTGVVYSRSQIERMLSKIEPYPIWLLNDDVYAPLVYGEQSWISPLEVRPEFFERSVSIGSASKAFAMTGWRVGWALAPEKIIAGMTKIQGQVCTNVCSLSQVALKYALENEAGEMEKIRQRLSKKRELAIQEFSRIPDLTWPSPDGAFYLFLNLKAFLGSKTDLQLCEEILLSVGVSLVPGTAFGMPGYARMAYTLPDEEICEGAKRLNSFFESLSRKSA